LTKDKKAQEAADKLAEASNIVTTNQSKLADTMSKAVQKHMPEDVLQNAVSNIAVPGPGGSILQSNVSPEGPQAQYAKGGGMPLEEAVARSTPETKQPKVAGAGGGDFFNKNSLGRFMQSVGFGMIDKPLGREADTMDYLGKTIGQIARLNEGSGLGAGLPIYAAEDKSNVMSSMNPTAYGSMQQELSQIPESVISDPQKSMPYYRQLLLKYPAAKSFLAEYFGLTRSYNYNYPQGLPQGKYSVGGPNVGGAAVGAE